jgi:hypothetical protein
MHNLEDAAARERDRASGLEAGERQDHAGWQGQGSRFRTREDVRERSVYGLKDEGSFPLPSTATIQDVRDFSRRCQIVLL